MKFAPVGRCIYCESVESLTDEHIVPLGLGGDWILPAASCLSCNKVTSGFERVVLRNLLNPVRAALELPTRRPKERPAEFPVTLIRSGERQTELAPAADSIPFVFIPVLPPPAALDGRTYDAGYQVDAVETLVYGNSVAEVLSLAGADGFSLTALVPGAWLQLIAKIALGWVVADRGLDALEEVFVRPWILGAADDAGRWIGSDSTVLEVEKQGALHAFGTRQQGGLLLAHVKLFASAHPTGYLVVVGRAS